MFKVDSAGIRKQLKWSRHTHTHSRACAHTHISSSIANLTASWYFIKIKYSEPNISTVFGSLYFVLYHCIDTNLCITVGIRCSSAGVYQTALHCCGRPLLDWGWIACIRRKASCTEPRCLYRDGSIRIHVQQQQQLYIYIYIYTFINSIFFHFHVACWSTKITQIK